MSRPRRNMSVEERFWSYVSKGAADMCWLWTRPGNKDGYGKFQILDKTKIAHRVSWELTNGPIPDGLQVLHKCDVPACVNPAHLWLGTQLDNMRDKHTKGRAVYARGEQSGTARLTEQNVYEVFSLRRAGWKQKQIADLYGVKQQCISRILSKKRWAHINV